MSWRSERAVLGLDPPGSTLRGPHEHWSTAAFVCGDLGLIGIALDFVIIPVLITVVVMGFGIDPRSFDAWLFPVMIIAPSPILLMVPLMAIGDALDKRKRRRDPELQAARREPAP